MVKFVESTSIDHGTRLVLWYLWCGNETWFVPHVKNVNDQTKLLLMDCQTDIYTSGSLLWHIISFYGLCHDVFSVIFWSSRYDAMHFYYYFHIKYHFSIGWLIKARTSTDIFFSALPCSIFLFWCEMPFYCISILFLLDWAWLIWCFHLMPLDIKMNTQFEAITKQS